MQTQKERMQAQRGGWDPPLLPTTVLLQRHARKMTRLRYPQSLLPPAPHPPPPKPFGKSHGWAPTGLQAPDSHPPPHPYPYMEWTLGRAPRGLKTAPPLVSAVCGQLIWIPQRSLMQWRQPR